MREKIIIVHIPKAAGQSLRRAILKKFDRDSVGFEYDKPMEKCWLARNLECLIRRKRAYSDNKSIVFGHFMVGKHSDLTYQGFIKRSGNKYVTFLRDPLQRAISHYYHWKRGVPKNHRTWEKFVKEKWSLERFLLDKL